MRFGWVEILLIAVVVLLLFGARRIPELMRGMGRGVREFKDGLHDLSGHDPASGKKP
jgi:sec-independent protein translocase protein TatA